MTGIFIYGMILLEVFACALFPIRYLSVAHGNEPVL